MISHLRIFTALFLLSVSFASAQKWAEDMQNPNGNYYQIKADFEAYWSTRDITEKGKGYKVFKRWEHFVEPRVYPSGNLSLLQQTAGNYEAWLKDYELGHSDIAARPPGNPALTASTTWSPNGPFGALSGSAGGQFLKSGRLNFITIDPTNTLNLWVGAPAGGLWSTTNGGVTWSTNTDQLTVNGCSDLVIDPTNSNIMYLAMGDGEAGDTRSIGVLKSTNGGATWNATGLTNAVQNYFLVRKLLINPSNTQIVLAATTSGIYRTTNGGTNWTLVNNQGTYDLEFKPGDPNTVYATGTNFRMSTNGGASFAAVTAGLPTGGVQRMAVAVTPNDANYVYVLASNSSDSGFLGLYRSTVGGTTFVAMTTSATINLLGWNSGGTDVGGQGWYDLSLAVSPLNKDEVVTGGVNVWRSTDGGSNWAIYGHWTGNIAPFTHADHHELEYAANGTLFNCNDGTVYRRTATAWQEIAGLMNISQIYKIGLSSMTANKWITGHQDNGTSMWNGVTYQARIGGDGMDCFIDRTNDLNVFGSTQNGGFQRSTNGGNSWQGATTGLSGTAPWVTVWKQDPQVATRLYCGRQNMFVSNNLAAGWSSLTALPATGNIIEFAIAPSNNQVIYVLKSNGIYKTIDGGTTWSTVTNGVPVASANPENICIDPSDPNNAWVVLSGYSAGNKVYVTTNGGASWTNISANLPNIPANCIVYEPGSNDMVYVGMDVGVYYRNATQSSWTLYNAGLPNVPVFDLEITAINNGLLHAATYGRGVWSVSLYAPVGAPSSAFSYPQDYKCIQTSITFSDQSQNSPTAWSWSVSPSAGVVINSPTSQNPTITFPTAGNYTVSMQASNGIGQGLVTTQTIAVAPPPAITINVPAAPICIGSAIVLTASGANTYTWTGTGQNSNTISVFPTTNSSYTVAGTSNSCTAQQTVTLQANLLPQVSITGPQNVCPGDMVSLFGNGAVNYTWTGGATGNNYTTTINSATSFSVRGADANGCENVAFALVGVFPLPQVSAQASSTIVCASEEVILTASGATNYQWLPSGQTGATLAAVPFVSTTFTLNGVDDNSCMNTSYITIEVSACEGISEEGLRMSAYTLFPNPTKAKALVKMPTVRAVAVLAEVHSIEGKLVYKTQLSFDAAGIAELSTERLAAGTYVLHVKDSDGQTVKFKFVKE